jgi:hypothetical protein
MTNVRKARNQLTLAAAVAVGTLSTQTLADPSADHIAAGVSVKRLVAAEVLRESGDTGFKWENHKAANIPTAIVNHAKSPTLIDELASVAQPSSHSAAHVLYADSRFAGYKWAHSNTGLRKNHSVETEDFGEANDDVPGTASYWGGDQVIADATHHYLWQKYESSTLPHIKWGAQSTAEQQTYRWGIRSKSALQTYRWGIRSESLLQTYRWGIR